MTLYLGRSQPRRAFKKLLGNANRLIITALVGLDGVERGLVHEVPEDLRAAWSPKDAAASAKRARRLILDMALIRAIDAIDIYLRDVVRKPALAQSTDLRRDLDAANLSIFKKLQAIERHLPALDNLPLAIVFLMVAWRNRGAHTEADRDAPQIHLDVLRSNADELAARFRGLDADMLLGGYDAVRPVTFKEVASLINAAHHLVEELDAQLLESIDAEQFLKDVVWTSLSDSRKAEEQVDRARQRRAVSVWGKDPSDREEAVLRLLSQQGFSQTTSPQGGGLTISAELVASIYNQTPSSILAWARQAS